ncbi:MULTISPECIES: phosphate ABC transporter substrate-binding protein PstS [Streptomyces]|uniref:phosphate ABC transporter substrate-binding protein PstS n=1 Tax=Streptomyces TaxID=1883 RepID=UPI0022520487|nr:MULTISPECIES: phosphate ABC transporter substrate-binding protein PstS [Streptomyces]MCX4436169.1 phosphate ABC transporter substrate-binding protein PstS [Streptomyces mirabilis]
MISAPVRRPRSVRVYQALALVVALVCALMAVHPPGAFAVTYVKISGSGSTWSANAIEQWRRNVRQQGMTVNYASVGSSVGRTQFANGTSDFGVSEIPYGLKEFGTTDTPPQRKYAYMPIVAGGTSFMYNLKIGGNRVTNLRLSGEVLSKIFTGKLTMWNAPEIRADNPKLALPARRIVPVIRSDGSGTTAQFTLWMSKQYGTLWNDYCRRAGKPTPCGLTSYFPNIPGSGFVAQSGSLGVAGYTKQPQAEGAITYVEYSYARNAGFPVVKVLNKSGYYVEPTASSVAVALTQAQINNDSRSANYLTQNLDGVYTYGDRRTYPLSSYSYMIVPTKEEMGFTKAKGATLSAFDNYFLCEGQQLADRLGYSPLPINLVQAAMEQVRKIPGAVSDNINIKNCNNPTFSSDGKNLLAQNAPYPAACDKKGSDQCATGTGGAHQSTSPSGSGTSGGGTGSGGSGTTGGSGTSGGSGSTGGSGATGTAGATTGGSGTAGSTGGTGGATAGSVVAPDTGQVLSGGGGTGDTSVAASPVSLGTGDALGLRTALMALSAVLLIGVVVGPPLIGRMMSNRARRKGGVA